MPKKMLKGGSCSSSWNHATAVYGSPSNQHAIGSLPNGGNSNQIAMNMNGGSVEHLNPSSYNENAPLSEQAYPVMKGGNRRGGSVLGEIAVPAALLIANEAYKSRSKKVFNWKRTKGKKKIFSAKRSRKLSRKLRR